MRDSDNLPPGTAGCDLPGNSRKEMAATAAMEDADSMVNGFVMDLRAIADRLDDAFDHDIDTAHRAIKKSSDLLEAIQVKLNDCCGILGQAVDG